MKLAFPNPEGPVFEWNTELREAGLKASQESPRRRMLIPIHRNQQDLVQRMVNILQVGTYIQPHRHPRDWAVETLQVIEGELGFVTFSESGDVRTVHRIPAGGFVDIEERIWHGVLALKPDTIILEVKRGPYDVTDKEFADWAPAESENGAASYLEGLEALFA